MAEKREKSISKDNMFGTTKSKMSFFERIQSFFGRKRKKALPEARMEKKENIYLQGNNDKSIEEKDFLNSLKVNNPVKNYLFETLDGAIQQYLFSYIFLSEKGNPSSYAALTNVAGEIVQGPSNRAQEASFLNALRESNGFNIMQQIGNNIVDSNSLENINQQGNAGFYHVMTKEWKKSGLESDMRLYINPTRKNLIELVGEIVQRNGNSPLYLKFESDNQMMQSAAIGRGRNEKIVIYSDGIDGGNFRRMVDILNQIKKEKPYLFDNCKVFNPFMKTVDGVAGYARNPKTSIYNRLDGKKSSIAKSYNCFLAEALEESTDKVLKDITDSDAIPKFGTLTKAEKLKMLLEESPDILITSIKEYLIECQKNNSVLDIKGVESRAQDINRLH